jgi:hypothetical protein
MFFLTQIPVLISLYFHLLRFRNRYDSRYILYTLTTYVAVLWIGIRDPGSGTFLTPGSGMGKKSRSRSGMNIPDHISESLETSFG